MRVKNIKVEGTWIRYAYNSTYKMGWQDILFMAKALYPHLQNVEILTFKNTPLKIEDEWDIIDIPEASLLEIRGESVIYDKTPMQFIFANQTDSVLLSIPNNYIEEITKGEYTDEEKHHFFDRFVDSIELNATSMRIEYNTTKTIIDAINEALIMKENFIEERIYRYNRAGGYGLNLSEISNKIVENWKSLKEE